MSQVTYIINKLKNGYYQYHADKACQYIAYQQTFTSLLLKENWHYYHNCLNSFCKA